jgi:hypothetical protein
MNSLSKIGGRTFIQKHHIPIYVGVSSLKTFARIVKYVDG